MLFWQLCVAGAVRFVAPSRSLRRLAMSAPAALIEVERKFEYTLDAATLQAAVVARGGELKGEKRFTDVYWDTSDCVLTRRDMWLRSRDGCWELKLPVEEDAKRSGGERTIFTEIEGADAVATSLATLMPTFGNGGSAGGAIEERLCAAGAQPFAEFGTVRTTFAVGKCSVDADVASFGHAVIEIEMMCAAKDEIPAALDEIEATARLLGAQPLSKGSGGKLETFIRRHCPDVMKQLVQAGILA